MAENTTAVDTSTQMADDATAVAASESAPGFPELSSLEATFPDTDTPAPPNSPITLPKWSSGPGVEPLMLHGSVVTEIKDLYFVCECNCDECPNVVWSDSPERDGSWPLMPSDCCYDSEEDSPYPFESRYSVLRRFDGNPGNWKPYDVVVRGSAIKKVLLQALGFRYADMYADTMADDLDHEDEDRRCISETGDGLFPTENDGTDWVFRQPFHALRLARRKLVKRYKEDEDGAEEAAILLCVMKSVGV